MAHNINLNSITGQHAFFSVKQKAWHGLGQIVDQYPTSSEAIQFAGLQYEVQKRTMFIKDDRDNDVSLGNYIEVPDYNATLRTDNYQLLGVVGNDYQIVQNHEAFSFFDAIVGGGDGILYETAGALGKGERIFITAKLPGYIRVGNGDDVTEKYIFMTTSHDGKGSITAAFTPIRIVCQNTLNAALGKMSNVVRIRHTEGAKDRLAEAHKVMGIADTLSVQLGEWFNRFAKVRITDKQLLKLIQVAMVPNKEALLNLQKGNHDELSTIYKNTIDRVYSYALTSDTQQMETTKGTLFGAYNAVTGYFQNVCSFKNGEAKLKSIIMGGTAQQRSQTAFNLCADFMRDGEASLLLN
ncbi:DUF932 domain-containing protein [Pedobacter sp. ASV28]|uniref:DUF932 domain-containing protein n=1 Tax=Pedobacter sp. ASV28 TaxID=2795123 RepID=UPI0018ED5E27|nr:DUF932 domain-containing protein [Pedobacter sp. ASV28]